MKLDEIGPPITCEQIVRAGGLDLTDVRSKVLVKHGMKILAHDLGIRSNFLDESLVEVSDIMAKRIVHIDHVSLL